MKKRIFLVIAVSVFSVFIPLIIYLTYALHLYMLQDIELLNSDQACMLSLDAIALFAVGAGFVLAWSEEK
jgi:hypothetical protein